jgi:hypothetical protein
MAVDTVSYKGQQIVRGLFKGATTTEELMSTTISLIQAIAKSPGEEQLVLWDFTGSFLTAEYVEQTNVLSSKSGEVSDRVRKRAYTGISGAKSIILKNYLERNGKKENTRVFDTEAEAMEWLIAP